MCKFKYFKVRNYIF